jgi:hypothetical protein
MSIKVKVMRSVESPVVVKVQRPVWQEFLHY